jgi:uncharacterized integral membrane protein
MDFEYRGDHTGREPPTEKDQRRVEWSAIVVFLLVVAVLMLAHSSELDPAFIPSP